jgi:hypothetical protein
MTKVLSLAEAVLHFARLPAAVLVEQHFALDEAARIVQAEAKRELGTYQMTDTGQFAPWAELAESTKDERVRQGYPENEPLEREGQLRDAIERTAGDTEAAVGVPNRDIRHPYQTHDVNIGEVAEALELGGRIPPRSFLGVAGHRKGKEVAEICGAYVVRALVGEKVVNKRLPIP